MVRALHRAGIEIILDVVYNHTAEGGESGPTLSFRGVDNNTYYILEQGRSRYANYSGTGNTINANHPVVRRMILDSLRYWVEEMHVDVDPECLLGATRLRASSSRWRFRRTMAAVDRHI